MADEKLIFPIGFDLEEGVKQAEKEWKSSYQKQLQKAVDAAPLKAKIELDAKGLDLTAIREYTRLTKEQVKSIQKSSQIRRAESLARERERVEEERVGAAKARRLAAEERLTQVKQRSTQATHAQNAAYKTQSGYLQRLFQRMVAYASVTQAFSFIRNIREVTAQFELQRVALGSIIGDLNEANAMFEQIKAAAVKSPFQIKELVTYTKQLAAYKIETDELFETTQKLADVSAGLGVGMERLVLAYGQIRATGYLRASEVRQLTEAGIPIVEELAKKMSQLRGETVSAAEVMGMISERAISFGMVKEVFDDMTSAGGMFYKMQEKQAETLAGQWSNLQDAISIMYEEIGNTEGVNNAMKSMIGLIKSLAENWRVVGDVAVWSVGAAMGYAKVIKPISELIQKHRLLNKAKEAEIIAEKNLARVRQLNAEKAEYLAQDEVVNDAWLEGINDRIKAHQEYADKHTQIASEARKSATALKGFGGALKSIGSFIKANWVGMLITAVTALVSWLISARQEANRLNKELAKIGTEGALQADQSVRNFERLALAIRESADGSAKQTEALEEMKRAYGEFLPSQDTSIINLVREKDGYNAVTQAIREKIALQIQEQKLNTIASEYGSRITKKETKLKDWLTGEDWRSVDKFSQEEATRITNGIRQAVSDGLISAGKDWEENAHTINRIIREQTGKWGSVDYMQGIERQKYEEFIDILYDMNDQVQQVEWSMESATGSLGKYTQAYRDFKEELKDVTGTGEKFSFEWNESKTKSEIKAYNEFIGDLLAKEGIKFDIGEAIDFKGLYEALGDNYPQLKQVVAKIQSEYEKLVPKDLEKLIKEQFSTLATKYGASLDKLQHYFKSADQSTQDWVKTLKDAKAELSNQIFDAKKLDKDITALEAQKQVIEAMITAWDNSEKTQKAGAKSAYQALKDELTAVEKIYKRYQDLRKLKSETDTQSILAKEFKGVSLTTLSKAYSPEQMIKVYQKALAEAQRLGKKDLVLEIQTKLGEFKVEEQQRELEQKLKDLSDKISRTKTAKEFFDRMLGLTGDKQLSASLTLSVYGEGQEDLGQKLASQTIEQLETAFEGVDISSAIDKTTSKVDYTKLVPFIDQLPEKLQQNARALVDAGMKSNDDWLTDLQKTYQKAFTFEERRTQVMRQEAEKRKEIEESTLLDDLAKKRYTEASKKREAEHISAINLEEFKASDDYLKIFEDIEHLSIPIIDRLIGKIRDFIATNKELSATDLKNLTEQIQKLEEGKISKSALFAGFGAGVKEWFKATNAMAKATKGTKEYEDAVIAANKAHKKVVDSLGVLQGEFSQAQQFVDSFAGSLGIAEDNEFKVFLDDMSNALGGVAQALAFAQLAVQLFDGTIKSFLASNPIGWILLVVSAVIGAFQAIANAKVRNIEKEIERVQSSIENLEYAYEKLQKAQEKAFGSDYISNYRQQLANLEATQDAYLKQAELERSKGKKADVDKIGEYEEAARDTADSIADMYGQLSEHFLGADLASAARDFAVAWIDAYKEFANTTDAMKAKFQDMIQNMVVESLLAKVMERALKPVFDMIDDMGEGDFYNPSFWQNVMSTMQTATENGVVGAENVMSMLEQMGINLRGLGGDLTGISRDIATASEESVLGLAAGINTQNFYISQVPPKLDIIISLLRGEGAMPQGSTITLQDLVTLQNQHLSYLPNIAQNTADTVARCERAAVACENMAEQLGRVIKPNGTPSNYKLHTTINS